MGTEAFGSKPPQRTRYRSAAAPTLTRMRRDSACWGHAKQPAFRACGDNLANHPIFPPFGHQQRDGGPGSAEGKPPLLGQSRRSGRPVREDYSRLASVNAGRRWECYGDCGDGCTKSGRPVGDHWRTLRAERGNFPQKARDDNPDDNEGPGAFATLMQRFLGPAFEFRSYPSVKVSRETNREEII